MRVRGQCFCGAVSFTALIDPARVVVCHCVDCQRFSGAPFRAVLPTPASDVTVVGKPTHYVKVADSGNRRIQAFCGQCGSQLWATEGDGEPKTMNIRLGCIDERDQLAPTLQIWGDSAMPWLGRLSQAPIHSKGPSSALKNEC